MVSTPTTSSSLSSRASLPATSAFVIAVSTMRSVEDRTSSRAFIDGGQVGAESVLEVTHAASLTAGRHGLSAWPRGSLACRRLGRRRCAAVRTPRPRPVLGGAAGLGVRRRRRGRAGSRCAGSTLPVLPRRHRPLRVLHLSDLHLTPCQGRKRAWLRGLAALEPDLVVNTGDNLAHRESVPAAARRLRRRCSTCPASSCFGSNDYFAPSLRNPLRYLLPDDGQRNTHTRQLPCDDLRAGFDRAAAGSTSPTGASSSSVGGHRFAFAGVDDPHLGYDDLDAVAGPGRRRAPTSGMGVTHAPYLRVLDPFAARRLRRRCWPGTPTAASCACRFSGALVTNCDLDPARARVCTGTRRTRPGAPGSSWLHVSAGPGHLAVRPGAVLLLSRGHPADAHARSRLSPVSWRPVPVG